MPKGEETVDVATTTEMLLLEVEVVMLEEEELVLLDDEEVEVGEEAPKFTAVPPSAAAEVVTQLDEAGAGCGDGTATPYEVSS